MVLWSTYLVEMYHLRRVSLRWILM